MNGAKLIKRVLLYSATINDPDKKIRSRILEDNRKFAIIWSIAQILYWGYCFVMSFSDELFLWCRTIYIAAISISVLSLICALFFAKKVSTLVYVIMYLETAALLAASVFIAWIMFQNASMTIMMFASVIIVPSLFINDTLYNILLALADYVLAFILLRQGVDPETARWGFSNLIIFASLGIVLGHFINKSRFERYIFAESALQFAELQKKNAYYDQMTGLQSRRAYSEMFDKLSKEEPDYCASVMADINGLKQVNDNCGHEAGDELICGASECLRKSFEGVDTIYRLGGDEFCIILTNADMDIDECLKKLEEISACWKGKYVNSVSISYGYASTKDCPGIDSIVKTADKRMYEFKTNYYKLSEHDRRKWQ